MIHKYHNKDLNDAYNNGYHDAKLKIVNDLVFIMSEHSIDYWLLLNEDFEPKLTPKQFKHLLLLVNNLIKLNFDIK